MATGASAASAATFYVNQRGSTSTCTGPGGLACAKVSEAVARAEKVEGPNTIEIASNVEQGSLEEGLYEESVFLTKHEDAGLTINGEEPGVVIVGKGDPGVSVTGEAGAVTLSNLKVEASKGPSFLSHSALFDLGSALTLNNVEVENESGEGKNGIEALPSKVSGSVTMNGGSVTMENASGFGVFANEVPVALNGVKILSGLAGPAEAGGVSSEKSSLAMTNAEVVVQGVLKPTAFGISADKSSVSLQHDEVRQGSPATGVIFEESPATVNGLKVEMLDPASNATAVGAEVPERGGSATFSHLQVEGTWKGDGLFGGVSELTLTDSRITQSALSESPALMFAGGGAGRGLLVQRSVLQGAPGAKPGALTVTEGSATTDSSEILGGKDGVYFENFVGGTDTFTLAGSTVDAGAPGISGGANGIETVSTTEPGSVANVSIQGSIVLEKQVALAAPEDKTNIACAYSAVPSQTQAAGGGAGAIACPAGASGNTDVNPLSSLFPEPLSGYNLSPSSSAVGSVPPGAISLPFGLTPSSTDLAGNPRTGDGVDACFTAQDKGALELQGHLVTCPATPSGTTTGGGSPPTGPNGGGPKPVAGVIAALTINPSSFGAAPSGATTSMAAAAKGKGKKRYGATISYRDSQIATATFTVLREESGRAQGKSCKKASKSNRHGKRCTLYAPVGTFSHADLSGANSLHFSGRLNGRKLAKGRYRLSAVAHNSAGAGPVATREFKITG